MRNYNGMKVMQIIAKMKEVDAKMKGFNNPNTSAGELMQELIFLSSIKLIGQSGFSAFGAAVLSPVL